MAEDRSASPVGGAVDAGARDARGPVRGEHRRRVAGAGPIRGGPARSSRFAFRTRLTMALLASAILPLAVFCMSGC